MQKIIYFKTDKKEGLYDITKKVNNLVKDFGIENGMINVYVRGATAGIMIQENWDKSVQKDVINFLRKHIPRGVWEHDKQDNNGAAHIKSGIVGPSETIPIMDGNLGLSRWQNIFLCEFDGPREKREIVVNILES